MAESTTPSRAKGCFSWVRRAGCTGLVVGGIGSVVGAGVLGFMYYQYVIVDPGPHIDAAHVRTIIAQESPVYYRDGTTRIGVFFEDEHRQYVAYERLPLAWQMGIVAAEDGAFWGHPGLNFKGLGRAFRDNLLAGGVVAGGSTLTQQTAKNLYYRPDRSLKSKGTEFLNALRLEAHFEKSQILTFYANQFHVSGNGRGLGIGARYFFDKEVEELEVEEAAFLAGLVKAPSRYDPFLGDEARRAQATAKANDRVEYVLSRMVQEPLDHLVPPQREGESDASFKERSDKAAAIQKRAAVLLDKGFKLTFKRGTFRFDSNAVLDEVARRLAEPPFDEVLLKAGIDDPATAGLKVVTTLDPIAQREAIYGLWHHLTEVGTWLEKLDADAFKLPKGRVSFDPDRPLQVHEFQVGEVKSIAASPKHLIVDLGGRDCIIDRDGVIRAAVAIERGKAENTSEKAKGATVDAFVDRFKVGDMVSTSIRSVEGTTLTCDLEVRPELQGAVIVLERGEVRAMVGGNDNRNFNRTTALRQMGSTWKPLVFHAALELGWSPADMLDNRRNVFPFSTTFYYPRPDHEPQDTISMSWAGVNSENLASVWLVYHLTDKLDGNQVKELARTLGLARAPDEAPKDYARRIQELGVLPTPARRAEADFLKARSELLKVGQLAHPEDALAVQSLYYGWGFDREIQNVKSRGARSEALRALDNHWTALIGKLPSCQAQHLMLENAWNRQELPALAATPNLSVMVGEEGIKVACGAVPEGYGPIQATLEDILAGEVPEDEPEATDAPDAEPEPRPRRGWFGLGRDPIKVEQLRKARLPVVPFGDVRIDERFHAITLIELDAAMKRNQLMGGLGDQDLYDPDVLYWHQDFRVLLALRYLESMARNYGVASEIPKVLSLPLGAGEITLEEVAGVYQGITSGDVWTFPGEGAGATFATPPAPTLLIAEIRDVDDNVLYRAKGEARRVAPVEAGEMTADILRNVVLHGTGRRARSAIAEDDVPIPVGGKTGTTNDFKNAVFAGYAPKAVDGAYSVQDAYAVAVYVGYDDNRPLKSGRIRLAGASGALPVWMSTVQGMAEGGMLGTIPAGTASEGGAWPLRFSSDLVRIAASETGDPLPEQAWTSGTPGILVSLPSVVEHPVVSFEIAGRPVRVAPEAPSSERPPSIRDLWSRRRDRENRRR